MAGLHRVQDSELPMQTSDFYSRCMLACKPTGQSLWRRRPTAIQSRIMTMCSNVNMVSCSPACSWLCLGGLLSCQAQCVMRLCIDQAPLCWYTSRRLLCCLLCLQLCQ